MEGTKTVSPSDPGDVDPYEDEWDDEAWPEDPPITYAEAIARLQSEAAHRPDVRVEWQGKRGAGEDARLAFLAEDGTEEHVRRISSAEQLDAFSDIVRKTRPIPSRHALWYPEEDRVTARLVGDYDGLITTLAHRMVRLESRAAVSAESALGRDVLGQLSHDGSLVTTEPVTSPSAPARSLRLRTASPELGTLYRRRYQNGSWVALELRGFGASDVLGAEQALVDYGTSYLHEITRSVGVSLRLWDATYRLTSGTPAAITGRVRFPARKYDTIPVALFSAAGVTDRDPLERYLKYYQVLEYYMPQAANDLMARQNASTVGKATTPYPSGDKQRDSLGLERNQLAAVVDGAVTMVQTAGFLRGHRLLEVLSDSTIIHDVRALPASPAGDPVAGHDYRPDLAERIYAIRCRIVHAKEGGGKKADAPLVPYSREARDLATDIEVVRFLADMVLRHWAGWLPALTGCRRGPKPRRRPRAPSSDT